MKKKYIQYRSSLLIGLLSLNTLSSCVKTSRDLGMSGRGSTSDQSSPFVEAVKDAGKDTWRRTKDAAIGFAFGTVVGGAIGGAIGCSGRSYDNSASSSNSTKGWGVDKPSWKK